MEVTFKNYRCFKEATLRLDDLTVIVGANASGKSTLAKALDPSLIVTAGDAWQGHRELGVRVDRRVDNGSRLQTILPPGSDSANPISIGAFAPTAYQMLVLNVAQLRQSNILAKQTRLDGLGSNLTNVFGSLTRAQQTEFSKQYCSLVPVYSDVDTDPLSGGTLTLRFQDRWNKERWYSPCEVSDGSLLTLAFLLLSHQSPPVDILVIEDPEHGLHPFLLGEIVGLLRNLATGVLTGRKMRVVLTTHSPTVLDFAKPEEIRVLDRQEDGSVAITELPTGTDHWRTAFKVYSESLGQAWLSGTLGGTP